MSHANTHVAMGIIVTGIISVFVPLTWWQFILAVCGAFALDLDFVLSRYAPEENHRRLITHTIWPGLLGIVLGEILAFPWLIIAGISCILGSIAWIGGQR
jgi:hypothetical protein